MNSEIQNQNSVEAFSRHLSVKVFSRCLFFVGLFFCFWGLLQLSPFRYEIHPSEEINKNSLISAVLSGFAVCVFIRLWTRVQINYNDEDRALLYLSGAMLVWGGMGVDFLPSNIKMQYGEIASALNNFCMLASLKYFDDGKPNYKNRLFQFLEITEDNYIKIIGWISFIIALLIFLLKGGGTTFTYNSSLILDLSFSFATGIMLGYSLWKSFDRRMLKTIGKFAIFTVVLALAAQILGALDEIDFFKNDIWTDFSTTLLLVYKILLIFVFGALAASWFFSKKVKKLVFDKQDMLHMIKNSMGNLIFEYEALQKQYEAKGKEEFFLFYKENLIRVIALRNLYNELYTDKSVHLKGEVNLHEYIKNVIKSLQEVYYPKKFKEAIHFEKIPPTRADSALGIAKIIVESIANSYKHGEKLVSINCKFNKEDKLITIRMEDMGHYVENNLKKGFGLKSIDIYLKDLMGEKNHRFTSKGNEFIYTFPLKKILYYESTNR